jgi:hypothetical protein
MTGPDERPHGLDVDPCATRGAGPDDSREGAAG